MIAKFRFLWILPLGLASGCYPGGDIDTFQETDTVLTIKNPDADFSANKTFSLPDQVVDLCDYTPDPPPSNGDVTAPPDCSAGETIDHSFDAHILKTVKDNLIALGYTQVDPNVTAPDVGLFVAGARNQIYIQYYYDYWYAYWGWYGGWTSYSSYNWYYPGVPVTQVYDVGTILITMVEHGPASSQLPVLWNAAINGLLGSAATTSQSRITTTINQAFDQSPYLSVK